MGKGQILLAIGIIEHQSEWKIKPHYMKVSNATSRLPSRSPEITAVPLAAQPQPPAAAHVCRCADATLQGGTPGSLKGLKNFWDPVGFTSKMDAKKLERQRLCELKNGRAAMLGITSVLIANYIPGSIPVPITFPDASPIVLPF